jgi:2Fe-2S ferredoxin
MFKKRKTTSFQVEEISKGIPFQPGETLLEALISEGITIDHSCEGMGSCGTCRIYLNSPESVERNQIEREMAEEKSFEPKERLACQLIPNEDYKISLRTQLQHESDWYKSK